MSNEAHCLLHAAERYPSYWLMKKSYLGCLLGNVFSPETASFLLPHENISAMAKPDHFLARKLYRLLSFVFIK